MLMAHGYAWNAGYGTHASVKLLAQYVVFYGLQASRINDFPKLSWEASESEDFNIF